MILTITLSPCFDLTYKIGLINLHAINTVSHKEFEPSGKGFNVAVDLVQQGLSAIAISPVPESQLGHVWSFMAREKVKTLTSKTSNEIRFHTSIVDSQEVTKFNEASLKLSDVELKDLISVIEAAAKNEKITWIAICGSIHPENANFIGLKIREICNKYGCKFAVDTSGESARTLYEFKPDFVKPNRDELAQLFPEVAESNNHFQLAVINLANEINGTVLCTDGSNIAYAANNEVLLEIVPPVITAVNSVGAGDAALAGYIAAESSGSDFVTAISMAMSWASAACLNPKTAGLNINAGKGAPATINLIGAVSEISIQNNLLIGGSK
jgi:1-phosphofructokinase